MAFPVRYVQYHTVEMPRGDWGMFTGLPANKEAQFLVEAYRDEFRNKLAQGEHEGVYWKPEPSEFDDPSKHQANLMDEYVQREAATVPIEVADITESEDGVQISAIYGVVVGEEELLAEEERDRYGPGAPAPEEPIKAAELPLTPFLVGSAIFGSVGYWAAPKRAKFVSGATLGLLGGITAAVAAQKGVFKS